jgi:hypothetical protein
VLLEYSGEDQPPSLRPMYNCRTSFFGRAVRLVSGCLFALFFLLYALWLDGLDLPFHFFWFFDFTHAQLEPAKVTKLLPHVNTGPQEKCIDPAMEVCRRVRFK